MPFFNRLRGTDAQNFFLSEHGFVLDYFVSLQRIWFRY
jgi:hypothetical protein